MNTVVPEEKLSRLRTLLSQWLTRRHASKHELQVLLGHLSHAAAVVRPGRMFLRQLIDTAKLPRLPAHKVRLNGGCRADISWWATFVQNWNGIAMFPQLPMGPKLISDASGSWGCGAYCPGEGTWFQLRWPQSWGRGQHCGKRAPSDSGGSSHLGEGLERHGHSGSLRQPSCRCMPGLTVSAGSITGSPSAVPFLF